MSNYDWNKQVKDTQNGKSFEPQKPDESAQAFKDRAAAADWAKKNA